MNKVFVIIKAGYDESSIEGIFSSKQKAIKATLKLVLLENKESEERNSNLDPLEESYETSKDFIVDENQAKIDLESGKSINYLYYSFYIKKYEIDLLCD